MAKKKTKKKVAKTTTKKVKLKVGATVSTRKKKVAVSRSTTKKKTAVATKSKSKSLSVAKIKAKRVKVSSKSSPAGVKRKTASAKLSNPSNSKKSIAKAKTTAKVNTTTKAKKNTGKAVKRPSNNAVKASLPPATAQDPIQFPEETKRTPKTKLSRKELNEFKKLLLAKRAELTGDVANISFGVNNRNGVGGDRGNMPIHMADIGSDNWEHEFTLGLLANEHERIRQIDDALLRIADRTYGVCLAIHRPIGNARLLAKPWAKYSIEYARAREEGRAV